MRYFYILFYQFAPFFWAKGIKVVPEEYTCWMQYWVEQRDGVETHVLYGMMFAISVTTLGAWNILGRMQSVLWRRVLLASCAVMAVCYAMRIGFYPPMCTGSSLSNTIVLSFLVFSIVALFSLLGKANNRLLPWVVGIFSLPFFFVARESSLWLDLSFIFDPALRMIHGVNLSEIYFQYDIFLSLLAALWMHLGMDLSLSDSWPIISLSIDLWIIFVLSANIFRYISCDSFLCLAPAYQNLCGDV